jgi:hypothetical protein
MTQAIVRLAIKPANPIVITPRLPPGLKDAMVTKIAVIGPIPLTSQELLQRMPSFLPSEPAIAAYLSQVI